MDVAVRHALTYVTSKDVPVQLVTDSLLANERLVIEAIRILEKITPGLDVLSIAVRVGEVSNSSPLRELLIATLVVTYQKDLVVEVPALIEMLTGLHVPERLDNLVTVAVVATAFYAVSSAIERFMPGKAAKKIVEEYRQKLERMSELSGIGKETIERYVAASVAADPSLTTKALQFFSPAKLEPGTSILLPDGETISADAIAELPTEDDLFAPEENSAYELNGVVIDIHRSDRDEKKHGWRAVISSISNRKIRMELAPTIDPESLWGRKTIVGDVLVNEERLPEGTVQPTMYHLMSVRD